MNSRPIFGLETHDCGYAVEDFVRAGAPEGGVLHERRVAPLPLQQLWIHDVKLWNRYKNWAATDAPFHGDMKANPTGFWL